jgi:hypothetical protein
MNFFPGGRGKSKLDGGFGKRQRWTQQAALTQVISDAQQLADILNYRAAVAESQNPSAPHMEFVVFEPPSKSTLFQKTLHGGLMRDAGVNCQATYAVSSSKNCNNQLRINDHKLSGWPALVSIAPTFIIAAAKDEEPDEGGENLAAGEPAQDGWRRSFRNSEPEKEDANLRKLSNAFAGQAVQGLIKAATFSYSCRRQSKSAAVAVHMGERVRQAADAKGIRRILKEKQAPKHDSPSSHDSSSDSSSDASGSSDLSSS